MIKTSETQVTETSEMIETCETQVTETSETQVIKRDV